MREISRVNPKNQEKSQCPAVATDYLSISHSRIFLTLFTIQKSQFYNLAVLSWNPLSAVTLHHSMAETRKGNQEHIRVCLRESRSRRCQTSLQQPGHSGLLMRMRSLSPYKTVPWDPITPTRHLVKILTGHQFRPQTKTLVSELWKSTSTFCLPTCMCTHRENLICINKFHLHKLNV